MKESEATDGQKLHALIISMLMRESFATSLKRMPTGTPNANSGWEYTAQTLVRSLQEDALKSFEDAIHKDKQNG